MSFPVLIIHEHGTERFLFIRDCIEMVCSSLRLISPKGMIYYLSNWTVITHSLINSYNGPGTYPQIVFNTKIFHPYVHPEVRILRIGDRTIFLTGNKTLDKYFGSKTEICSVGS